MEQASRPEISSEMRILEAQLRDCFGRVVYTHKTQEKCADILNMQQSRLKTWQIVLSALTTSGIASVLLGTGNAGAIISTALSLLLLIVNTFYKSKDYGMEAQKHKQSATNLWLIREKYLSLLTDIRLGNKDLTSIISERDKLLDSLHKIYLGSPSTNFKAYSLAKEALKKNEELTFTDEEIDAFLPELLKKEI
jgi:hypothetical protein